jgi:hypothetical protein
MELLLLLIIIPLIVLFILLLQNTQSYSLQKSENLAVHIHVPLSLIKDGHNETTPYGIGIRPDLWKDHHLDKYRGKDGESPLHTHSTNGSIHVESNISRQYTFGEFLDVWGIDKSKIVKVINNGTIIGDYENLALKDASGVFLYIDTLSPERMGIQRFIQYNYSGISIQIPADWVIFPYENSTPPACFVSEIGESFNSEVGFFPPENEYLDTPQIFIEIDDLPVRKVSLNEYSKEHIKNLSTDRIIESIPTIIAGNIGHKIVFEYYGYEWDQVMHYKQMQLWTIKDNKVYLIVYNARSSTYDDYLPILHQMINSVRIDVDKIETVSSYGNLNYGIIKVKNYGCIGVAAPAAANVTGHT